MCDNSAIIEYLRESILELPECIYQLKSANLNNVNARPRNMPKIVYRSITLMLATSTAGQIMMLTSKHFGQTIDLSDHEALMKLVSSRLSEINKM